MRPWEAPALAIVASVGIALRFVRLDLGWFGVDQARDIATALDIVSGRSWPLIGPTMRRVTRLGALYHYFWALPYALWRDPIAGYWFAATLSAAALVLTWYVARRLWGPAAGVVSAAVAAAHPVWVIDGRMYWAPAALPFIAVLLTLVALAPPSARRVAVLGALLGLAVQLHLTMIGWVAGMALLALVDRVPVRMLGLGLAAGVLVGAPALWAPFTASAETESGLGVLAAHAPHATIVARLVALAALPGRLVAALGGWNDGDAAGPFVAAATVALAVVIAAGLARLVSAALGGDRGARVVLVPGAVTTILVLGLPGDAWHYYLDSALPLWALAAGAAIAQRRETAPTAGRLRAVMAACTLGACVVLAAATAEWLWRVGATGYMRVDPTGLTLGGRPGRDAASAGRLTTLAVKRRAATAAASLGGDFEAVWRRLHGPALADAAGDNGFWVRWSLAHATRASRTTMEGDRHLAFWYRDDPTAIALAAAPADAEVERTRVGPLLAVRYPSTIAYETCRADGMAVAVPIRVAPDPRRYGDGTPALPSLLPARLSCARHADPATDRGAEDGAHVDGQRRLVAALGGEATVTLAAGGHETSPMRVAALCAPASASLDLVIDRRAGAPAELDLYDVPLGVGCDQPQPVPAGAPRS